MIKPSALQWLRSSVKLIGLFCLLVLLSCQQAENPDDVTISFWTALAENDLATAQDKSTADSAQFFNTKKVLNASLQLGKVSYESDGSATVETYIRLQSAAASSFFKTFLVKDTNNEWKVDYARTLGQISEPAYKDIFVSISESGSEMKSNSGVFVKELGRSIVTVFKNLKDRLLE